MAKAMTHYKVGDFVRVLDSDHCYRNYGEYLKTFPELQSGYRYGATMEAGTTGTVVAAGAHPYSEESMVVISNGVGVFIFDPIGIELAPVPPAVTTHTIQLNDEVIITNPGKVFDGYSGWLINDAVLLEKFIFGLRPQGGEVGRVVKIAPHITWADRILLAVDCGPAVGLFIIDQIAATPIQGVTVPSPEVVRKVPDPHRSIINMALHAMLDQLVTTERMAKYGCDHVLEDVMRDRISACKAALLRD